MLLTYKAHMAWYSQCRCFLFRMFFFFFTVSIIFRWTWLQYIMYTTKPMRFLTCREGDKSNDPKQSEPQGFGWFGLVKSTLSFRWNSSDPYIIHMRRKRPREGRSGSTEIDRPLLFNMYPTGSQITDNLFYCKFSCTWLHMTSHLTKSDSWYT